MWYRAAVRCCHGASGHFSLDSVFEVDKRGRKTHVRHPQRNQIFTYLREARTAQPTWNLPASVPQATPALSVSLPLPTLQDLDDLIILRLVIAQPANGPPSSSCTVNGPSALHAAESTCLHHRTLTWSKLRRGCWRRPDNSQRGQNREKTTTIWHSAAASPRLRRGLSLRRRRGSMSSRRTGLWQVQPRPKTPNHH